MVAPAIGEGMVLKVVVIVVVRMEIFYQVVSQLSLPMVLVT